MKRYLSAVLSLMLVLGAMCMPALAWNYANDVQFSIDVVNAVPGETVEVDLWVNSNIAFNSMALYEFTYDASVLSFSGFNNTLEMEDKHIFNNPDAPAFDGEKQAIVIAMSPSEALNCRVCTLKFTVEDDAPDGKYEISMKSLIKENSTVISSGVTSGEIIVAKEAHVHTGGKATCDSQAICDDCGKPYGEKDAKNHSGKTEVRGSVAATETTDGYTGDTYCLGCNKVVAVGEVIPAFGDISTLPAIIVGNVSGLIGNTVTIPVTIQNNPGVVSVSLDIDYDDNVFKLIEVRDTALLPGEMHTDVYEAPYALTWENDTSRVDFYGNGTLVELVFAISENAPVGSYVFDLSIPKDGIYNVDTDNVDFVLKDGRCEVQDYVLGDVNGDGEVTNKDRMMLSRYLAKWSGYDLDQMVFGAADINGDGEITNKDRAILARHLAKWSGYEDLYAHHK